MSSEQDSQQSNKERRKHPRIPHHIPLKISSDDVDIVTETKNVSCSGAYCRIDKFIEPMTKLKLHLLLPIKKNNKIATKKVTCEGIVVRTESVAQGEGFDMAIFFSDIKPKDSRIISEFVEESLGDS